MRSTRIVVAQERSAATGTWSNRSRPRSWSRRPNAWRRSTDPMPQPPAMVSHDTQPGAAAHPTEPALRALVVDTDGTLSRQIASAITDSTARERFAWERSASAADAHERMHGSEVDVVLLPIRGTSPGLVS